MTTIKIENIKGNSYKDREMKTVDRPKLDPVVKSGGLVRSKKSLGQKFKSMFITEDVSDIKRWLFEEVIVPGVKSLILDSLSMAFFHETVSRGGRRSPIDAVRTSYQTYYKSSNNPSRREPPRDTRRRDDRYEDDRVDYRDITLIHRDDADHIVRVLHEQIREYGKVSIGDLYSLIDMTPKQTDFDWGWTDERSIGIRKTPSGFLIDVDDARFIE